MEQYIDLNRLRLFVDIVNAGNLTKASQVLGLQKSKLSRDLSLLETVLGTPLVYRTTRKFHLTDAGKRLLDGITPALQSLNAALDQSAKSALEIEGTIQLTCPEDMGELIVASLVDRFLKEYPKVRVQLHLTSQITDLVAEGIDLGLRAGHLRDSSLKTRKVGKVQTGLFCSKAFYDQHNDQLKIENLSQLPTVTFRSPQNRSFWNLQNETHKKRFSLTPVVSANSFLILRKFVLQSHGIGLLPLFVAEEERQRGELIHIFKDWTAPATPVQLVFPQQRETPARIKVFTDFLVKEMKIFF